MKGSLKCLCQPNQAAYADTEIKLDAVTEPEPLHNRNSNAQGRTPSLFKVWL
jgi:hypothetical protein